EGRHPIRAHGARSARLAAQASAGVAIALPVHHPGVVLPHAAQVVLVHGVSGGAAARHLPDAVQAAGDVLPVVATCLNADLVALHDLDVIRRDEPGRPEPEFVLAQAGGVDLLGRALE